MGIVINIQLQEMQAYDLVGFQTVEARQESEDYLLCELGFSVMNDTIASKWTGRSSQASRAVSTSTNSPRRATVAIEQSDVLRLHASLKPQGFARRRPARLFGGPDRMLEVEPDLKGTVLFLQVAARSLATGSHRL